MDKGTFSLLSVSRIGPGSTTALASSNLFGMNHVESLLLTVKASIDSGGSRVTSYVKSGLAAGTFDDDLGIDQLTSGSPGADIQASRVVNPAARYVKVQVKNLAAGTRVGAVTAHLTFGRE